MSRIFNQKAQQLADGFAAVNNLGVSPESVDDSLFVEVGTDAAAAERIGYSSYSYWRSTLRVFLGNKGAIFFLCVLALMLGFTFVQPFLPDQKMPTTINLYDDSGKQIRNKRPYFTNVIGDAPEGTELILVSVGKTWAGIENKLATLARNARVEKIREEGAFTYVRMIDGTEGWAQTNFLRYDVEEEKDGIPASWPRLFMNTTLNRYPAQDVWVLVSSLSIPEHNLSDKTFPAVTTQTVQFHSEQTQMSFWFGTNSIGQDLWSRIWSGTRTSLFIGVSVGVISALIGILVGAAWGYIRKLDRLFTEIYNVWENIPYTVLRMLITYIMRPSLTTIIFVMSLTGWLGMARFVRNQIVIIRDREYNLASRCLGTRTSRMITRNLLPYLVSVIMLRTALAIPEAIGTEVFLTYIGLGLPVSMPALGNLINEGRLVMTDAAMSYQIIFPAVIVSIITMSFYALGNAFSDAADPRNHV
ncbi:hypothetical protein AGMMS49992_27910 [Clostridia bacterium]|nr:hypothetical protein AGMMS49992_27910 [Clostridia bacterium]